MELCDISVDELIEQKCPDTQTRKSCVEGLLTSIVTLHTNSDYNPKCEELVRDLLQYLRKSVDTLSDDLARLNRHERYCSEKAMKQYLNTCYMAASCMIAHRLIENNPSFAFAKDDSTSTMVKKFLKNMSEDMSTCEQIPKILLNTYAIMLKARGPHYVESDRKNVLKKLLITHGKSLTEQGLPSTTEQGWANIFFASIMILYGLTVIETDMSFVEKSSLPEIPENTIVVLENLVDIELEKLPNTLLQTSKLMNEKGLNMQGALIRLRYEESANSFEYHAICAFPCRDYFIFCNSWGQPCSKLLEFEEHYTVWRIFYIFNGSKQVSEKHPIGFPEKEMHEVILNELENMPDQEHSVIENIPPDLYFYYDVALKAVRKNYSSIRFISPEYEKYVDLAKIAVETNVNAFKFVPTDHPGYFQLAILAVKTNVHVFEFVSPKHEKYKHIAILALVKDPSLIYQVPTDRPDYVQLAELALRKDPSLFYRVPKDHSNYFQLAELALKKDPSLIYQVPKDHPDYVQLAELALKKDPNLFHQVPRDHHNYFQLAELAVVADKRTLFQIPKDHPNYFELAELVLEKDPSLIYQVPTDRPDYFQLAELAVALDVNALQYVNTFSGKEELSKIASDLLSLVSNVLAENVNNVNNVKNRLIEFYKNRFKYASFICDLDVFWKQLCTIAGYDREDRTTGYHNIDMLDEDVWEKQFKKWYKLRFKTSGELCHAVRTLINNPTGVEHIEPYGPIGSWDVSLVKSMSNLFKGAIKFNQPLEGWNVSNVEDMSGMFDGATVFNQPLEKWNVSNVKDMSGMFKNAIKFDQPLQRWIVSNVEDMSGMFDGATVFNQPLEKWNVSNVKDMSGMFKNATTFNQPLKKWNVSNVTTMNGMFEGATAFNQPLEEWNVSTNR
jgi:hypothetical protein